MLVVAALATLGGLLTITLVAETRTSRQAAALERLLRAETIGTSGFYRLVAAIDDPADALEIQALQGMAAAQIGDTKPSLAIESSGGKIDVMAAEMSLLEGYLNRAGLAPSAATGVVGEVAEARVRRDGATALEAVRTALSGTFRPAELDMDLTRFGTAGIDPRHASNHVLHAIPDLAPTDAEQVAAAPLEERPRSLHLSRYFASMGRRFSLVTRVDFGPGHLLERQLPIELSTSGKVIVLGGPF